MVEWEDPETEGSLVCLIGHVAATISDSSCLFFLPIKFLCLQINHLASTPHLFAPTGTNQTLLVTKVLCLCVNIFSEDSVSQGYWPVI